MNRPNSEQPKELHNEPVSAQELRVALDESLNLQRHYAKLLNTWDGGKRMLFRDADEWILRLRVTGTLPPSTPVNLPKDVGGTMTQDQQHERDLVDINLCDRCMDAAYVDKSHAWMGHTNEGGRIRCDWCGEMTARLCFRCDFLSVGVNQEPNGRNHDQ